MQGNDVIEIFEFEKSNNKKVYAIRLQGHMNVKLMICDEYSFPL